MEKLDILLNPIHTVGWNPDLAYIVCGKWSWYCRQPGAVCGEWGTRVAAWLVVLVCTWRYLSSSAIQGEEERETRNERVGKDQGASMYGRAMTNRSGAAEQHTVKLEQVPRWIEQERLSPTASSSLSDGNSDRDFLDPLTSGTMIPHSFSLFTS